MVNLGSAIVGPLAGPECQRALARGWLILVRTLAALAILAVTLFVLWYCWICVYSNPDYRPYTELRIGLAIVEGLMVTIALVLAPAILAGSLAGEKERGALGLLLTTRVTAREIVGARFAAKLSQVAMILLAGLPAQLMLAALAGMNADVMATLVLLPAVLVLGSGGLSTAISAVSRRGRDALMTVYFIQLALFLAPMIARLLGVGAGALSWLEILNPFSCLRSLVFAERLEQSLVSMALWLAIGAGGVLLASCRLAPSCLGQLDGARTGRRVKRRGRVPEVGERPMLWKELYVERAGTLGGFGWWVGAALTIFLAGGSLAMAGVMAWDSLDPVDLSWSRWAQNILATGVGDSSFYIECLIEWAVGLRAAVAIASERERGTWDAILTSPLEGKEILRAKLWGSLHALRWLFAAALLAWSIAALTGAMRTMDYVDSVVGIIVGASFIAAVGLRTSLSSATATRAMAVTIGVWLGALVAIALASLVISLMIAGVVWMAMTTLYQTAWPVWASTLSFGRLAELVGLVVGSTLYVVLTLILVAHTRIQFDRLAGRRAGGRLAVAADRILHGQPVSPVESEPGRERSPTMSHAPDVPRRAQPIHPENVT